MRFRGVMKKMFTRGGYNVYPREIERAPEGDGRIAQACVRAVPDPAKEHDIVLTVVPASDADLDEAAVRAICRERLAPYKQPGVAVIES